MSARRPVRLPARFETAELGLASLLRHHGVQVEFVNSICDCAVDPYHRWNCAATPIWAQTIRDLDVNPWTIVRPRDLIL